MTEEEKAEALLDVPPGCLPGWPTCPRCGHLLNGYTAVNAAPTARMKEGDFTVCGACSLVAIRTESGFRRSTPKEVAALSRDEREALAVAILTLREARRRMVAP